MDTVFHPFPLLPKELRQAIWRACLPVRICELDVPAGWHLYDVEDDHDVPCKLSHTTKANNRPPIITRVCQESRSVAMEAARDARRTCSHLQTFGIYDKAITSRDKSKKISWLDRIPGVVHESWTSSLSAACGTAPIDPEGLHALAEMAASVSASRASIMVDRILGFMWETPQWLLDMDDSDYEYDAPTFHEPSPKKKAQVVALERLPSWLVVVQIVVIHTDFRTGAATGLFGPLGDAPVQIISMTEEATIDAYFSLAVACEQGPISIAQDLERRPLDLAKQRMRDAIVRDFGSEDLVPVLHPAIMFRLCTLKCNHLDRSDNDK